MQFRIKNFRLIILIMIIFTGIIQAQDIMPVNEIKSGMNGIGKTVFHGFQVESFPIKVIDVLKNQGLDNDLIIIKTGGEKIDQIGGIAAGMSGSPVYIEDKLIGAISFGWAFSDHHYALVTPIESMLKLFGDSLQEQDEAKNYQQNIIEFETPLFVSGLNGRAFNHLQDDLDSYGLKLVQGGSLENKDIFNPSKLEPGSAIAVQLVRGDINIASIGTLTYLDKNRLLAFGHPFNNKGQVDYLLSEAYINGIIPSLNQPFKLGSPTEKLLGSIKIDRGAGLVGELNNYPKIIPLRIKVLDQEMGVEKQVNVQLVKDEDFITPLATNIALQSIDNTLDRIGKGTAWVRFNFMGNGLPDLEIKSSNIYYSRHDIGAMAISDFAQLLHLIVTNPFKDINLIDLELEVEVDKRDNVALVQEVKVLNEVIKPGDILELEVTIHPYRQKSFIQKVFLDLPVDIQLGKTSLLIDGGYTYRSYQLASDEELEGEQELNQAEIEGYKDFESIIDDYLDQPRNNELIVELIPTYPIAEADEEVNEGDKDKLDVLKEASGKKQKELDLDKKQPELKKIIKTEYVLEGSLVVDINIEESGNKSVEPKNGPSGEEAI